VTAAVRAFASERGLSERTAWRWLLLLREQGSLPSSERPCAECNELLPEGATLRRRYCGARCRMRACRRRQRAWVGGRITATATRRCASRRSAARIRRLRRARRDRSPGCHGAGAGSLCFVGSCPLRGQG